MSNHTSETPLKTCRKCGVEKPATREHFSTAPRNCDGLDGRCKTCQNEAARIRREKDPEHIRSLNRKSKTKHRDKRNAETRQWFAEHPDYRREWDNNNPDKAKEYKRRTRAKNRESVRAYNRRYHIFNRDFIIARMSAKRDGDREGYCAYQREWRKQHPEIVKHNGRVRRAREAQADGRFTRADVHVLYEQQNGYCAYCGINLHGEYHVDHYIPLSKGGSNWPDNLMIACEFCNDSKGAKLPWEWNERLK